jgi:hypothetical protein
LPWRAARRTGPARSKTLSRKKTRAAASFLSRSHSARAALSSLVRPGFFLSFYFWLDAAAVLSLGFELPALRGALALGPRAEHIDLTDNPDSILRALGDQASL